MNSGGRMRTCDLRNMRRHDWPASSSVVRGPNSISRRDAWLLSVVTGPLTRASRTYSRTSSSCTSRHRSPSSYFARTAFAGEDERVFCHPELGTPLDPRKLTREYLQLALKRAGITKPLRAFHDLRHTPLTHEAAAGNLLVYVQMKAAHSQSQITERYIHAAQVLFPGSAAKGEARMFALTTRLAVESPRPTEDDYSA
jgi:integrase